MDVVTHAHHAFALPHLRQYSVLPLPACHCGLVFPEDLQGDFLPRLIQHLSPSDNSEDAFADLLDNFVLVSDDFAAIDMVVALLVSHFSSLLFGPDTNVRILSKHVDVVLGLFLPFGLSESVGDSHVLFGWCCRGDTLILDLQLLVSLVPLLDVALDLVVSTAEAVVFRV